jgi:hypothetical protein
MVEQATQTETNDTVHGQLPDPMYPGGFNIVRHFINSIYDTFSTSWIGSYYVILHYLISALGGIVFLFSNNLAHLIVINILIILDGFCIMTLHNCPLTLLEQKYMQRNLALETKSMLHQAGIVYNCEHDYESQFEFIINVWSFVALKMFVLMLMKIFRVQSVGSV